MENGNFESIGAGQEAAGNSDLGGGWDSLSEMPPFEQRSEIDNKVAELAEGDNGAVNSTVNNEPVHFVGANNEVADLTGTGIAPESGVETTTIEFAAIPKQESGSESKHESGLEPEPEEKQEQERPTQEPELKQESELEPRSELEENQEQEQTTNQEREQEQERQQQQEQEEEQEQFEQQLAEAKEKLENVKGWLGSDAESLGQAVANAEQILEEMHPGQGQYNYDADSLDSLKNQIKEMVYLHDEMTEQVRELDARNEEYAQFATSERLDGERRAEEKNYVDGNFDYSDDQKRALAETDQKIRDFQSQYHRLAEMMEQLGGGYFAADWGELNRSAYVKPRIPYGDRIPPAGSASGGAQGFNRTRSSSFGGAQSTSGSGNRAPQPTTEYQGYL